MALIRPFALSLCLAGAAQAQDARIWSEGFLESRVQIHAPTVPDAVATVTFRNEMVHTVSEHFDLTYDGGDKPLPVTVYMDFNVGPGGAERITVLPPDGYMARPPSIEVREDQTDVIHIIEWRGF